MAQLGANAYGEVWSLAGSPTAMQIGEEQEEFEILPEEEPPVVLPERQPHQQPEAAPA